MRNADGYTPKERAIDIVLTLVKATAVGRIDFDLDSETPSFKRKVIEHLEQMHDKMLDNSGMSGLPIFKGEGK